MNSVIKQMIDLSHDVSMLRHEIAPGEMAAFNQDIRQFRRELDGFAARLDAIEEGRNQ